jgi:hypothetical protein
LKRQYTQRQPGGARQPPDREEANDGYLGGYEELPQMSLGSFIGLAVPISRMCPMTRASAVNDIATGRKALGFRIMDVLFTCNLLSIAHQRIRS